MTVDVGAATLAPLGPETETCPVDFAYRDDGRLYGVTLSTGGSSQLVLVDPATGEQTDVGPVGFEAVDGGGLEFDVAGNLWFYGAVDDDACDAGSCLYSIDAETGASTLVGDPGIDDPIEVAGMTRGCDPPLFANDFILEPATPAPADGETPRISDPSSGEAGVAQLPDEGTLLTIDTATAGLNNIGPLGGWIASGIAFDADAGLWGVGLDTIIGEGDRNWAVFRIDPSTGAATDVVPLAVDPQLEFLLGLTLGPSPVCAVPVPAPVVLEPTFTG